MYCQQEILSQDLMRSSVQLPAVFDAMQDIVLVYNTTGELIYANKAALRLLTIQLQLKPEEYSLEALFAHYNFFNEQGRRLSFMQLPMCRFLHGETISTDWPEIIRISASITTSSSASIPSDSNMTYFKVTGSPLLDAQEQIIGGINVLQDLSQGIQYDYRLRQALQSFYTLTDDLVHLPEHDAPASTTYEVVSAEAGESRLLDLIRQVLDCQYVYSVRIDPSADRIRLLASSGCSTAEDAVLSTQLQSASLAETLDTRMLASLTSNEIIEVDLLDLPALSDPADYAHQWAIIAPILRAQRLIGVMVIKQRKNSPRFVLWQRALVDALTKIAELLIGRLALFEEWTQAHAREQALEATNQRFDTFMSLASHELKSPLAATLGSIQLSQRRLRSLNQRLLQQELSQEQILTTLERIQSPLNDALLRGKKQNELIDELLNASRIRANKFETHHEAFVLQKIIHTALQDLQFQVPERVIQAHLPADEIVIQGDVDQIGIVISNYLSNAIKYSAPDQPVDLRLEYDPDALRLSVQDTGAGIRQEDQATIWERFYRTSNVNQQQGFGAGLGLGLFICRAIIKQHGGSVGLRSTPGQGSTFWFTLPLSSNT